MKTTATLKRIQNEIKQIEAHYKENSKMFLVKMVDDNAFHWHAIVYGPEKSLYEKYQFELEIKLPDDYPFSPPIVKFITPIQHVNINTKGDICLDILKNNWAPSQNIQSVLISIISLLSDPNYDDPLNSDLAKVYRENKSDYKRRILETCKNKATKIK